MHEPESTAEEATKSRGITLESHAKSIVLKTKSKSETKFYLAVVSANERFSSKKFKANVKCKSLKFANAEDVFE